MNPHMKRHSNIHRPALRPLACGVLLALSTATSPVLARHLDNENATIEQDHAVEAWRLTGTSHLTVNGATTHQISIQDTSTVTLNGATLQHEVGPTASTYTLSVLDNGTATATGTAFVNGGVWVANNGRAVLTGSTITFHADAPSYGGQLRPYWGMSINNDATRGTPSALLDATTLTVADREDKEHYSSGIGVHMAAGELVMRNASRIEAANVGVIMHGSDSQNHALSLSLDSAHIRGGRNAAIEINASKGAENTFNVQVANGSTLSGGDGNLLLVRAYRDTETTGNTLVTFDVDNSHLDGNVTFDDSAMRGRLDVALRNNARLKGQFNNVTSASIGTGSAWTLTGSSTVGHLELGSTGRVMLGDGRTFNTLSLDTFHGDGGTLVFNTALGDDGSQTDKVVITGDATGNAHVVVTNAGGQGAQTINGIALIDIEGQSHAEFTLQGRATGGLYEYALVKGADGSWYLRSELDDGTGPEPPHECVVYPELPQCEITLPVEPIDPEQPDPEQPDKPQPVLRPETGAYLANQAAMGQLLQHNARERMAAARAVEGLRTWAFTGHNEGRMDVTGQQTLRTSQSRLQVGADIGTFDRGQGRVGALLTAGKAEATARSTVTGYRADARVEGGAAGLYAHWTNDALYLDASVQRGRFRNRVMGEGVAVERYDTGLLQTTLEAGYRFDAGHLGNLPLHLEPQLQLTHTTARMDAHVESNGTVVERAGGNGLATRVGLRLEGEATLAKAHLTAYLQIDGYHDARRAALSFDGETVEGGAPGSRVALRAGGQLQVGSGLAAWGELGGSQGAGNYRDVGARVGVSYRW